VQRYEYQQRRECRRGCSAYIYYDRYGVELQPHDGVANRMGGIRRNCSSMSGLLISHRCEPGHRKGEK
jgi:hypothetical protein